MVIFSCQPCSILSLCPVAMCLPVVHNISAETALSIPHHDSNSVRSMQCFVCVVQRPSSAPWTHA